MECSQQEEGAVHIAALGRDSHPAEDGPTPSSATEKPAERWHGLQDLDFTSDRASLW